MLEELIRLARNAAAEAVIREYYKRQHEAGMKTVDITKALVEAMSDKIDYVAEMRGGENDDRLMVVNCIFQGRDKRFLTVFVDRNTNEICAHANHKLDNPSANLFQRDLNITISQLIMG